ncbi:gfo/Idh/MocA family oxidoreductase [Rhodohalobacter sp. SW132]|uniref:Gfo/Idh/MocA family protein n=1 Tax=Rhodohalobacter sp. SW132 TaxID=2293433 RepID=UPI000E2515D6|nr:Gfo/Idh/MocA family oxidoreductase [Rhodohalobacter sp. SW132]REL38989.1 gfo/Idh/MocA family oxidoreductase [Rhodohalobacter sp. SW132]
MKKDKVNQVIKGITRRDFLGKTAAAAAGISILPSYVVSGLGHKMPSDKLNIACVGVGGRGFGVIRQVEETENIVALCDVDWRYSQEAFDHYPDAQKFWDWRKMFDEMGDDIDAVVVATSDHTHATIAAHAMTMGKHVYVEKPLTHTVYESRLLTKLAEEYKVATQMGDQGASGEGINLITEWVQSGLIGDVTKIESFTNRPIWLQGQNPPEGEQAVPDTLDWDLFVGPAQMRPYNEIYTPWNFRGWWDFGTGALGDMACHILHAPFKALELGYPTKVQGSSTLLLKDSAPTAQKVRLTYPERESSFGHLPEVDIYWYDGGIKPMKPEGWPEGRNMNHRGGGVLFHGTKDTLVHGCYGSDPWLLSGNEPSVQKTERRVQVGETEGESAHVKDWARACKESPESRTECKSSFGQSGPFNEMVVMGVLAVRLQNLNKELEWDGEKMEFTNISDTEELSIVLKDEFRMEDGNPSFSQQRTDPINAAEFANSLIKTEYREGWTLPDMPA